MNKSDGESVNDFDFEEGPQFKFIPFFLQTLGDDELDSSQGSTQKIELNKHKLDLSEENKQNQEEQIDKNSVILNINPFNDKLNKTNSYINQQYLSQEPNNRCLQQKNNKFKSADYYQQIQSIKPNTMKDIKKKSIKPFNSQYKTQYQRSLSSEFQKDQLFKQEINIENSMMNETQDKIMNQSQLSINKISQPNIEKSMVIYKLKKKQSLNKTLPQDKEKQFNQEFKISQVKFKSNYGYTYSPIFNKLKTDLVNQKEELDLLTKWGYQEDETIENYIEMSLKKQEIEKSLFYFEFMTKIKPEIKEKVSNYRYQANLSFNNSLLYQLEMKRKLFLMSQLSNLISPKKQENLENYKKLYPTINLLCLLSLRAWENLRKITLDYGSTFFIRLSLMLSFYAFYSLIIVALSV
ncbi:hypothetical protein PPERSA_12842 [Pseudocohnilembus persalinus]|uniref:Transmembrane protein n=1 Tax=Pseudocohnilembus persalinus TaxID=266149 RepID=A0A0V0QUV1_PSEPJ|nr:hypothetical protein PPERSA_12842 [Pseudocohnilembus persalinus]|eukprot:KRX06153.1 hypothetical protein PPERSA_12842 [Pseudocohnilembus persalinus]